ncbi:hypothetical protein [Methylobacterium sp. NFXW15]|uniref:hypothetical protein n=1 Tax=Methylobacterium sp. NFXW15 TaxID=2819512 RepID=UPI003CF4684F
MRDTEKPEDPAELAASLRSLFDSVVNLPVDDPLKVKTRDFLARILGLLEEGHKTPHRKAGS